MSRYSGERPLPALTVLWRLTSLLAPYALRVLAAVLLGALTVGSGIALMGVSAWLISAAALRPSIATLNVAIVGVRFFGISRGLLRYLERLASHSVTFRLLARLRVWFYRSVEPLAPARLIAYRSGDLLGRIVSDINILENFYVRAVAPPLVALVVTLGASWFMVHFHPSLGLALLAGLLLAGLALPVLVLVTGRRAARALIRQRSALQTELVDAIQGLPDLLAFGAQGAQLHRLAGLSRRLAQDERAEARTAGMHEAMGQLLANGTMWLLLSLSIALVTEGLLDGVNLAGVALIGLAAFEAVQPLPTAAQQLESCLQAGRRLLAIVDARPLVEDPPTPGPVPRAAGFSVSGLRFRYGPDDGPDEPWALDGVSFELPPGKHLAVVGPSGAGKSSLLNILLRFWPFQAGRVLLDGRPLESYEGDIVRALFGLVTQDGHVFNAPLGDNIRLARPRAGPDEVARAVAQAQLGEFVAALPQGLETGVGQLGMQLSGGQRQRLLLARSILRDPAVLALDEPTANLDAVTERRVLETIFALARGRCLLLITHRLVGLEKMDEILVLDAGKVVQRGRHRELVEEDGLYRTLWRLQNQALLPETTGPGQPTP
jgi:thiol reductant ABC exporter CydC subunit